MNPNVPYNTGALQNMVTKVKAYCAHIIPLVFDNTLSYYESICACVGKVNELCDAVIAQNLTIVEFTHLVEVELDKLTKYIDTQIEALQTTLDDHEDRIHTLTVKTDNQELVLQNIEQWREWASGQLSDIRDILDTCLKQSDITDTITDGDTTHVPTADAVYDAIQNATGVTVRDAQGDATHGFVKGILSTNPLLLDNPLSVTNGEISIRKATKNVNGVVQVGDNINVTNGVIDVPLASPTAKGLVMASNVDSGLTAYNGTIRANLADPLYIDTQHNRIDVKPATNSQLGVVAPRLGGALDIQSDGEIDAKDATTAQKGVVKLASTLGSQLTTVVPTADVVYNECATRATENFAVRADTPDSEGNSQLYKINAQGVRTDVYPTVLNGGGGGTIPDATTTTKGKVQIGDNIDVSNGVISVPNATQYTKGVVQAGDNIEIANGAISVPDATQSKKGVVMLDATVTQSSGNVPTSGAVYDAIQSASGTVPDATTTTKGKVQIGDNINVSDGVISVYNASETRKGVAQVSQTGSISATQGVIDVKLGNYMTKNQTGAISPTVADDTAGTLGVVGSALGGSITINNGEIDVKDASTSQKGVIRLASTLGSQLTTVVPTADVVYNECASRTIENLAVRSDTPDANGKSQLYKINSQGVRSNVEPLISDATNAQKGILKVNNTNGLTISNGAIGMNRADEVTWGTVMVGDNITSNNGEISVPDASINTAGVVMLDDTVTQSSDNVPTSGAVYDAIQSATGAVSRSLVLEGNSNPNSGAECFLVHDINNGSITPTQYNIINSDDIPTRAIPTTNYTSTGIHIFVRLDLLPTNFNYNQQAQIITLENKRTTSITNFPTKYINGFIPYGYIISSSDIKNNMTWNVGETYTDSNGISYRHIYTGNWDITQDRQYRVKIDL